jgi:hypothetical protein
MVRRYVLNLDAGERDLMIAAILARPDHNPPEE